jgi:transposase
MPKGVRQDYTKEFKLTAVHLMKSGLFRPKEIFAMLGGIDRQTVYRWIKEYDAEGESAFEDKNAVLPAKSLKKLQKEIEDLRLENEILKKATAYFAERNKKK